MSAEVFVRGVDRVIHNLEAKQAQIERDKERAARSAANVFRRYVRLEARKIRGRGAFNGLTQSGRRRSKHLLERDVRVEPRIGGGFTVREFAPHAHLVIKGHRAPSSPITPKNARALAWGTTGQSIMRASSSGGAAKGNNFVHRAFLLAGQEPLIAARVVLFDHGPEVS